MSLDNVGIPEALNSVSDLNAVVSEVYTVRGRLTALFMSISTSNNRGIILSLLTILLIAIPVGAWAMTRYLDVDKILSTLTAIVTGFVSIISIIIRIVRKALTRINYSISIVESTKKRIELVLSEKRKNPTIEEQMLHQDIGKLNEKEKEATARLSVATKRLIEIEERIRVLKQEWSLSKFLEERISTEDYRKHLGIISTIRKDFESLVERLKDMRQQLTNDLRPVERIVLYIDDLDRCPTTKVIEVLQAVHLLLAYPLFVVVVGVDPRWLLHSLDSNYSAFESEPETYSDDPALWRTTPQNFLEKIFQIPFTLRQMTDKGFGNLMEGLLMPMQPELTSNENESVETSNKTVSHPTSVPTEVENLPNQIRDFEKSSNVSAGEVKISPVEQGKRIVDLPPVYGEFKVNEESLTIRSWETNFASELFRIISTPRAAKRFANIYRILKASVQREDLANFEGSAELPGEFQLPMLLLAILTGTPSLASKIFPKLKEGATEGIGIKDSLEQADADDKKSGWNDLLRRDVLSIVERSWFPNDIRLLAAWLPKVSRFSFEVGRLV